MCARVCMCVCTWISKHEMIMHNASTELYLKHPYHLYHVDLSWDAQLIQKGGQVLLHLNAVVVRLRDGEDPQVAVL